VGSGKRLQAVVTIGTLVAVMVGGLALHRFWRRELSHITGAAEWIWVTDALEWTYPACGLFVTTLTLDAPPGRALLKVCGDREYVVYVNGSAAACGWSRPGFRLDLYDIAHLLRQGENVIATEVRSPTPAGGLLLALDVGDVGHNIVVSGPQFVLRERFSLAAKAGGDAPIPVVWGAPPHYPWGYPEPVSHPRTLDEVMVEEPVRVDRSEARGLPRGGWEFDLPHPVTGYLWLDFEEDGLAYVATAADAGSVNRSALREAAQPVIRLQGQRRWLDPYPRRIATIEVFGRHAPSAVEVWPLPGEFSSSAPGVVRGTHGPVPRMRWTIRNPPG
jgi:hypothetical protein